MAVYFLFAFHEAEAKAVDSDHSDVFYNVYFEKENLKESDSLFVKVILNNEGDVPLTNVKINIISPAIISWRKAGLRNNNVDDMLNIGLIAPHSRSLNDMYLKSGDNVPIGDYNVMFVLSYEWKGKNNIVHNKVVVEIKKIKVNFLGSDNIANIPLQLVSIIVPGMIFLITIALLRVKWFEGSNTGDRLLYSVLLSVPILSVSNYIFSALGNKNTDHYFDINNGISINKLLGLIGLGLSSGIFFAFVVKFYRLCNSAINNKIKKSNSVNIDDEKSCIGLLEKVLKISPYYKPKLITVKDPSGVRYIGYHYAKSEGMLYLLGNFRINVDNMPINVKKSLKDILKKHEKVIDNTTLLEILKAIRKVGGGDGNNNLYQYVSVENFIIKINIDNERESTSDYFMKWDNADKVEIKEEEKGEISNARLIKILSHE